MSLRPRVGATVRPSGRVEVADTAGGGGSAAATGGVARVSSMLLWDKERPPCDRRARLVVGAEGEKTIPVAVDHVVPSAVEVVPAEGRVWRPC